MHLSAYPNYKDVGCDLLGLLPEHLQVQRVKSNFKLRTELSGLSHGKELLSVYTHIGVKPRKDLEQKGNRASTTDNYWVVEKGDIVCNKLLAWMGAIGVSEFQGVTSPAYDILRPVKRLDPFYYHHLFRSPFYLAEFKRRSRGIMDMRLRLYFDQLGQVLIPVPPVEEQQTIGRFVRRMDHFVNGFIRSKRRLINLLNEQKQAIIYHAVTRGFDSTVPLKASGTDWLGDVPEHWTIRKVSRTFKTTGSGTTPSTGNLAYYEGGEIPWVITGDLKNTELQSTSKFVTLLALQECSALTLFPAGSVIVAMYGATIGKVGLLRIPACVNQACCVLAHSPFMSPEYALQLFIAFRDDIVRLGVGGGQPNISQDIIKQLRLPVPPLEEQETILTALADSTHGLDQAIAKTVSEIDLIREFRTRLVADVVAGQLDVRDLSLPEIEDSLIESLESVETESIDESEDGGVPE